MISRILPHPLLSLALLAMWVMLDSSVAPATLAMGAIIGLGAPFIMRALEPDRSGVRRPLSMLRLAVRVATDIVRSNYAVAMIILGGHRAARVSGFIEIPLEMRSRYGLAVMAMIITSTPGTLWVQYNPTSGHLLLHVLDLVDEAEWVRVIKGRYEKLLMEIFP